MKKLFVLSMFAVALCAEEKVDLAVIQRIKKEAFQNSKVMDHLFWLTDVYGPRLTGSPGFTAAANWAVKRLREFGIDSAATHPWGKFGRSWRLAKFSISLEEPEYAPLIGFPLAWSANTNGPLEAEPVLAPLTLTDRLNVNKTEEELQKYFREQAGKLRGKIVLLSKPRDVRPVTAPPSSRFTERGGTGARGGSAGSCGHAALRPGKDDPARKARRAPRFLRVCASGSGGAHLALRRRPHR